MLSQCIYCHVQLPRNQTVEHFSLGRRIAFDPARGRLWAICNSCRRWNLAPIEERWEALEELERLTHDRGRLLSQTDSIALFRAEDLDVIRVGKAKLVEEAWWRYGQELQRRRAHYRVVHTAEWATMIAAFSVAGLYALFLGDDPLNTFLRWRKFGKTAWRGDRQCRKCGESLTQISFEKSEHLVIGPSDTNLSLELRCKRCGFKNLDAGFTFEGVEAERMLRRVLARQNYTGATEKQVKQAVGAIDEVGSPHWLIRKMGRERIRLHELQHKKNKAYSMALEIAVNDEAERQLLELELAELEARWREEEQLAVIVDGELTELPLLERIRLKLPG